MINAAYEERVNGVKRRAQGCWTDVLKRCGVDDTVLNGKNQPCPMCGGTDRFQYTDKFGAGNYICRGCGPGDGFKLLEGVMHIDFKEAFKRVQEVVGSDVVLNEGTRREPSSDYMKKVSKQIWEVAKPVAAGDDVDRYLRGRGLGMELYPRALRCHPALGFYIKKPGAKKATLLRNYPAMIAPLQAEDGHATTVHRTYLENGKKAAVAEPKKVLNTFSGGPAIRLFDATEELALTEGIETGLAVHLSIGVPVWAAYSASNLEHIWIPPSVKRVRIYADNDANFAGQAAAYALAKRLKSEEKVSGKRDVQVFVPQKVNIDWADVWVAHLAQRKAA